MPLRTRVIRPLFFEDNLLATLPDKAKLLFLALQGMADRDGRLIDDVERIKAGAFPYEPDEMYPSVDLLLWHLHAASYIIRYIHGKGEFIEIQNFHDWQTIHRDEAARGYPPAHTGKHREAPPSSLSFPLLCSSSLLLSKTAGRQADAPVSPTPNGKPESSPANQPVRISEWPATAQAIRSSVTVHTGDGKIGEIIFAALQAKSDLTDSQLAEVVPRARKMDQKHAGLFKHTIPELLRAEPNSYSPPVSNEFHTCDACGGAQQPSGDRIAGSKEAQQASALGWRIICECR